MALLLGAGQAAKENALSEVKEGVSSIWLPFVYEVRTWLIENSSGNALKFLMIT
jgi:hypothetical protein